jgi:hypothetical protein
MYKSSPVRQLDPKITLPVRVDRCPTFFHVKFNIMRPTLILECGLDPIFEGKWYRHGLNVRMASLG